MEENIAYIMQLANTLPEITKDFDKVHLAGYQMGGWYKPNVLCIQELLPE